MLWNPCRPLGAIPDPFGPPKWCLVAADHRVQQSMAASSMCSPPHAFMVLPGSFLRDFVEHGCVVVFIWVAGPMVLLGGTSFPSKPMISLGPAGTAPSSARGLRLRCYPWYGWVLLLVLWMVLILLVGMVSDEVMVGVAPALFDG